MYTYGDYRTNGPRQELHDHVLPPRFISCLSVSLAASAYVDNHSYYCYDYQYFYYYHYYYCFFINTMIIIMIVKKSTYMYMYMYMYVYIYIYKLNVRGPLTLQFRLCLRDFQQ